MTNKSIDERGNDVLDVDLGLKIRTTTKECTECAEVKFVGEYLVWFDREVKRKKDIKIP